MLGKGRKKSILTQREQYAMRILWEHGRLTVKEMLDHYPEPQPHFNTISTVVRGLEEKGFVGHTPEGRTFRYHTIASPSDFSSTSLLDVVRNFFSGSYINAVSTLVKEEKISVDELKQLIRTIEEQNK